MAPGSLVAPNVESIVPYVPGKPIEEVARELGLPDCVKLASNENPIGTSPKAAAALREAAGRAFLYPDGSCFALRAKLAARHGVTPAEIAVGNGTNELIALLARTFLSSGEEAVISATSFPIYGLVLQACGRTTTVVPMRGHRYDLPAMAAAVGPRTKLVFIANPDNPNGSYVTAEELSRFLDCVPERVIVALDEAYFEFVEERDYPDATALRRRRPRLVVLRTFSKIYGLAGARVGYAVADPDIVSYVDRVRDPFNVSALAQAAAIAALDDEEHVQATLAVVREGRALLARELPRFGFTVLPSVANFLLVEAGRPGKELFEALLRHGVIVRPMASYGLPGAVRISIGLPEQNARLLSALAAVVARLRTAGG